MISVNKNRRHNRLAFRGGLLFMSMLLLSGCAEPSRKPRQDHGSVQEISSAAESSEGKTEPVTENSLPESSRAEEPVIPQNNCLPVLSLQTEKTGADALKFVTDPVAGHVSGAIASWTPGYVMPPEPYYETCTVSLTGTDGSELMKGEKAQVKVRGNWTTSYDKKPLRLKFAEKQNLLNLNGGAEMKNWVLLAEFKDNSMLRNKTALEIARGLLEPDGLYAADAAFVEVYINQEYWGVYLLTEQQQVNRNRIDIAAPKKDETDPMTGYFLEFDGNYQNEDPLHQFYVTYADNAPLKPYDGKGGSGKTVTCQPESSYDRKLKIGFTIKSDIRSQEQHDFIASYVENVYRIMYEAAYNHQAYQFSQDYSEIAPAKNLTPQQAVEQVVDVQSLADLYILSDLTCDADLYWSSFFMDADFGEGGSKKLTFEAPWDFDSALGIKRRCIDGTGFYAGNSMPDVNDYTYETINPWLAVLSYEDWFQELIRKKWTAAYDAGIFTSACDAVQSDTQKYADAFARNTKKWGSSTSDEGIARELAPEAARCRTQPDAAAQLRTWLESRIQFLNEQWHL